MTAKEKLRRICATICLLCATVAQARPQQLNVNRYETQINLLNGAVTQTWIDGDAGGLHLRREYSSRSLRAGLLGLGWCTWLDIKLIIEAHHAIVEFCESDAVFIRKRAGWKSANKALALKQTKSEFVLTDGQQKLTFARDGSIKSKATRNTHWFVHRTPGERGVITIKTRALRPLTLFLRDGRIARLEDRQRGFSYIYKYDHHQLTEVRMSADSMPKRGLAGGESEAMDGLLFSKFQYDEYDNLRRVQHADGSEEQFRYDQPTDRVISYGRPDRCEEEFVYRVADHRHQVWAFETCGERRRPLNSFEFIFAPVQTAGAVILSQIRALNNIEQLSGGT